MPTNPNVDPYSRLAESDAFWFPEGQPIGANHDDAIGHPVLSQEEAGTEGIAYEIGMVTHEDGRVTVEYLAPGK